MSTEVFAGRQFGIAQRTEVATLSVENSISSIFDLFKRNIDIKISEGIDPAGAHARTMIDMFARNAPHNEIYTNSLELQRRTAQYFDELMSNFGTS